MDANLDLIKSKKLIHVLFIYKAGTLRRFVDVVQQFALNYDLYSISGDELILLLLDEFKSGKPLNLKGAIPKKINIFQIFPLKQINTMHP